MVRLLPLACRFHCTAAFASFNKQKALDFFGQHNAVPTEEFQGDSCHVQGCGFDTIGTGVTFNASSTYKIYFTQVCIPYCDSLEM